MKSLSDSIRKSLAHRHMGHQMIGAIALNVVRDFLIKRQLPNDIEERGGISRNLVSNTGEKNIEGYVRFKTMFLKIDDQALKIKIFQQKNQILNEVNLALEKLGYKTKVEEIRLK